MPTQGLRMKTPPKAITILGHNYIGGEDEDPAEGHNYIGHNYIDHNYIARGSKEVKTKTC